MKIVEITYRFEGRDGPVRERPADAAAAQRRMDDGSRAFAEEWFHTPASMAEWERRRLEYLAATK